MTYTAVPPADTEGAPGPGPTEPFLSRAQQEQAGQESSDETVELNATAKPVDNPGEKGMRADEDAFQLRRFARRNIFLIVVPPLVAAYFVVTQVVLFSPDPETVPYGHRNATWVFYSWFLIGVFGVGAAQYGLEGIEAALLQEPFWAPNDAKVLAMHSEKSWSGFSGWVDAAKPLWRRKVTQKKVVGRMWLLLATQSLIVTVGLALSGLAMELYDGYVKGSGHPTVVGRTWDNFQKRTYGSQLENLTSAWTGGGTMNLPGKSIIYTPPGTDRRANESLASFPNSLPTEGGHIDIFLAPQAAEPVEGNAWGLRLGYRCDLVTSMSEFTILNKRSSSELAYFNATWGFFTTPDNENIHFRVPDNRTFLTPDLETIRFWGNDAFQGASNLRAYGETGVSRSDGGRSEPIGDGEFRNFSTFDEKGLREHGAVFEMALWQVRREIQDAVHVKYTFNETIEPAISDVGSPYLLDGKGGLAVNSSFFPKQSPVDRFNLPEVAAVGLFGNYLSVSPPIGVRCMYQYAVGYADLHPESATFTSFASTGEPPTGATGTIVLPWSVNAIKIMEANYYDMFTAGDAPPPVANTNEVYYTTWLQPQAFLQAVLRAFAVDAQYQMYDGLAHFGGGYEHPNLTATKEGKILGPGPVPPILPAVLLCIWAAGCVILGVVYGFKPRWADTLNGFTMLCLGADFAHEIRSGGFGIQKDFAEADGLGRIPGMVGDVSGNDPIGHLSLVDRRKGGAVRGGRLYH